MKNVIERAVVLARGEFVDHEDLVLSRLTTAGDTEMGYEPPSATCYQPESLADVEKAHILRTLKATAWNKSKTATILGIERSTLDRKIRRYELEPDRPRL
jgi:Nif-specific regulatory protein